MQRKAPRGRLPHFGAVRNVAHTRPTHQRNVHDALRLERALPLGGVEVFVHALLMPELDAPRNYGERRVKLEPRHVFELGPAGMPILGRGLGSLHDTAIANASLAAERSFDASSRLNN